MERRYDAAIDAARALEREVRRILADTSEHTAELYEQAKRRAEAGDADRALELLDSALAAAPTIRARAEIQHLRGRIGIWQSAPLHVHELLVTEAAPVEQEDPALASLMLSDAAMVAAAADVPQAVLTARRAYSLGGSAGEAAAFAELALGISMLLGGDSREGDRRVRAALDRLDEIDPGRARLAGSVLLWLEEYEKARLILERLVGLTRTRARQALPNVLDTLAALNFRTGHWTSAEARSSEALRLARELGQRGQTASCLTTLGRLAACRGQEKECRGYVAEALELVPSPDELDFLYAVATLGSLELALGRLAEAASELEKLDRKLIHEPLVVPWLPDLVETYVRAGRSDDAAIALAMFDEQARDRRQAWTRAALCRCRGLVAQNGEFERHFRDALEWHAQTETPFERARSELCFGERLRRARRAAEAKPHLRSALKTFERLGAAPWAERARRELGRRAMAARGSAELTPHERQVAELVARGATNREAAAALFVTPRTIEYHLANAYRKLNVRSRTELARVLEGVGAVLLAGFDLAPLG